MKFPHSPRPKRPSTALVILILTLFGLFGLAASPAQADTADGTQPNSPSSAPRNLTAEPSSTTELSVNWQSTTGAETSPNGFIVAVRRTHPNPVEPIGTPKCAELWRPKYEQPTAGKQYATECVVDGLEVGAHYEIQVVETFYYDTNSLTATTYSATYVHGPTNLKTEVTWKAIGSEVLATWDMPTDRTNINGHGVTLFNDQNRYVASCYRSVAQTGRCTFDGLIDGDYRAETYISSYYGSRPQPISTSFSINRVVDPDELDPDYNWWSTTDGQMYVNVSWNHVSNSTSSSYTATADGTSCSARATSTPQRLNCDVKTDTDNMAFPAEARIRGGNVDHAISLPAPPDRPKNPTNVGADEVTQTSARISWDHDGSSNATIYAVWMTTHTGSCTMSAPFPGRSSCRLDGLEPGTTYVANVYADSEIGRRSKRTARVTFTTDDPPAPPPPPELPPVDPPKCDDVDVPEDIEVDCPKLEPEPCDPGGKYFKKQTRAIKKANKQYQAAVDKAIDKLEDRPKKLAKSIKRLKKKRDKKIAKAEAVYDAICRT